MHEPLLQKLQKVKKTIATDYTKKKTLICAGSYSIILENHKTFYLIKEVANVMESCLGAINY